MGQSLLTERLWLELPARTLSSAHRRLLIESLSRETSVRKLRLFAAACVRAASPAEVLTAIEPTIAGAEAFADGQIDLRQLEQLRQTAYTTLADLQVSAELAHADINEREVRDMQLAQAACGLVHADIALSLHDILIEPFPYKPLLAEVFGNPFRPVKVAPEWLEWNRGLVPRMASDLYDSRRFEDCPILADALEEAGCTETVLLDHLRGNDPHVRGCWALDLLLCRE